MVAIVIDVMLNSLIEPVPVKTRNYPTDLTELGLCTRTKTNTASVRPVGGGPPPLLLGAAGLLIRFLLFEVVA